jgi:hypothetical protein
MNDQARDFGSEAAQVSELMNLMIEQIRKLSELHEEGILTDEEFTAKKKDLLSRI